MDFRHRRGRDEKCASVEVAREADSDEMNLKMGICRVALRRREHHGTWHDQASIRHRQFDDQLNGMISQRVLRTWSRTPKIPTGNPTVQSDRPAKYAGPIHCRQVHCVQQFLRVRFKAEIRTGQSTHCIIQQANDGLGGGAKSRTTFFLGERPREKKPNSREPTSEIPCEAVLLNSGHRCSDGQVGR